MTTKRTWYVEHNGKAVGPISTEQLKQLAASAKINFETTVRCGDDGDWVKASKVRNLFPPPSSPAALDSRNKPVRKLVKTAANPISPLPAAAPTAPVRTQVITSPAQVPASIPPEAPMTQPSGQDVNRFMGEGQDPAVITKLLERVQEICTSQEEPRYMAVQQKPVVNISPDAIVLTNRRAIVFRPKVLGRLEFVDCLWLDIADVHMKEHMMGATISVKGRNGHVEAVDYLPKAQARRVYAIAQEMEEQAIEMNRSRRMEEARNSASQVTVNTAVAPTQPAPNASPASDLTQRMKQLQEMNTMGLLGPEEFEAKRAEILSAI